MTIVLRVKKKQAVFLLAREMMWREPSVYD